MNTHKTLLGLHEEVPADHYDLGIKNNLFQRYWHRTRFLKAEKLITPVKGNILDIGCHGGLFTSQIKQKCCPKSVYGIDVSFAAIKKAIQRIPKGHFQVADAHNLPFKNNFFDAAFCMEVLEHVDDPQKVMVEMKRVLVKGGYGLVLVPTDNFLFKLIWFIWNLRYHVWRHTHIQSFTSNKLETLITSAGLRIISSESFNLGMLKLVKFEKTYE